MRGLNYADENEISETIYLYEMQVKAYIWEAMKTNYENIRNFKAK
jgi:hypothetical protein